MKKWIFLIAVVILAVLGYGEWASKQDAREARVILAKLKNVATLLQLNSASKSFKSSSDTAIQDTERWIQELQSIKNSSLPELRAIAIRALKSSQNYIRATQKLQALKDMPLSGIAGAFKTIAEEVLTFSKV
ncbi:MAG: hypothetical protein LBJ59_09030 [Zoogloeaceae bacterium]|jgi:hypothetical protein|nr:hypothetical protein [Zoogloeaceae bacterium]